MDHAFPAQVVPGAPIPTAYVPVVVDDSTALTPPPCNDDDQLLRWRAQVETCTQRPVIRLFGEATGAPLGQADHLQGQWIAVDATKPAGPHRPRRRRLLAFRGRGPHAGLAPRPLELVQLADCLSEAWRGYLRWTRTSGCLKVSEVAALACDRGED